MCVCVNKCFVVFSRVICADERRLLLKTKHTQRERERDIIVCSGGDRYKSIHPHQQRVVGTEREKEEEEYP